MRELQTVSFEAFKSDSALAEVLIDLDTVPTRMRNDYRQRNANVEAYANLCSRCDGTGNEHYASYRACTKCGSSGRE